jgi:saccharopine dehydrogenase (NAD+, L-lysine forming)
MKPVPTDGQGFVVFISKQFYKGTPMNVLLIGAGGVGGAFGIIAARRNFIQKLVVADLNLDKAQAIAKTVARDGLETRAETVNASSFEHVLHLIQKHNIDAVVNLCAPLFNPPIFQAAYSAGIVYLDTACNLSEPHPTNPYNQIGKTLGAEQFAASEAWYKKGALAITSMGVEPGLSDLFARYARDHLFSSIEEIGIRDGGNLQIEGYAFAPTFNIWTTIEECLNPPILYTKQHGWHTGEPFCLPEVFSFPEGIGNLECVCVEHEEVLFIPRYIDLERCTFKYGLGEEFVDVLKTLHKLGLDSTKKIQFGDFAISPRDFVAAALPDPAKLGERMHGQTCAGTWVKGIGKDGLPRETYIYHLADNAQTMREYGTQAVVWQTAINPVVALELIHNSAWRGAGVYCPEHFDALPFLELLGAYGAPHRLEERGEGERASE